MRLWDKASSLSSVIPGTSVLGRAGQGLTAEWGEAAGETPRGRLLGLGVHGGGLCAVSEGFPEEVPLRRVLEVGLDGWPRIL